MLPSSTPRRVALVLGAGAAALATAVAAPAAQAAPGHARSAGLPDVHGSARVCAAAPAGYAACASRIALDASGHPLNGKPNPHATTAPAGYGPTDIRSAYNLTTDSTATVAIVDAYDDPTAASDLAVYRKQYGLPPCGTGCFTKVNQSGGTSYPRKNGGWAQEISLDLDMVSATCPGCNILLVEASSASFADLGTAVNYAASVPGVVAISNSYGGSDSAGTSQYNHPGIAITASTGDNGYQVQSPASFPHVVAVGGTSLKRASNARGWTESAWSGAGSGCSTYNAKPSWQTAATSCSGKANADVSAVADPNTGVAVYDSTAYQGYVGWMVFGGTSASSPIVASVYALAGKNFGSEAASYPWGHTASLNDVTSGSNGTCSTTVWCHAGAGWDGPTGLGTPNGTGAF